MKIALLGATGATGREVLQLALAQGHEVNAVVRDAAKLGSAREGLRVFKTALTDVERLTEAFRGVDGIISTLGVSRDTPQELPSRALPHILDAMKRAGIKRYVGISGGSIDVPGDEKSFFDRFASQVVRRVAPLVVADKERELKILQGSSVNWTLVRPPRLVNGPFTNGCRVDGRRPQGNTALRGDVAHFMLAQVRDAQFTRQAPFVAS